MDRIVLLQDWIRFNDHHINFAQKLVQLQYPCTDGFRLPLLQQNSAEHDNRRHSDSSFLW